MGTELNPLQNSWYDMALIFEEFQGPLNLLGVQDTDRRWWMPDHCKISRLENLHDWLQIFDISLIIVLLAW